MVLWCGVTPFAKPRAFLTSSLCAAPHCAIANSERWFESMAASANNRMEARRKRVPCFRRGSVTCSKTVCTSTAESAASSLPFGQLVMDSVYCIGLFLLGVGGCLVELYPTREEASCLLLPVLERISPAGFCSGWYKA